MFLMLFLATGAVGAPEFTFGGLSLDMTWSQVKQALGEPSSQNRSGAERTASFKNGVGVSLHQGRVKSVYGFSSIRRGEKEVVRLGTPRDEVIKALGTPDSELEEAPGSTGIRGPEGRLRYRLPGLVLDLQVVDGKIAFMRAES